MAMSTPPELVKAKRKEEVQYRVIVCPDGPACVRWTHVFSGSIPEGHLEHLVVPYRVESRLVVTYTTPWREVERPKERTEDEWSTLLRSIPEAGARQGVGQ